MDLYVDDQLIADQDVEQGTVADAVRFVQDRFCAPDRLVVGLRCDGEDVPAENMANALKRLAPQLDRLDVFTGTKRALVVDVMSRATESLDDADDRMQAIAETLIQGDVAGAVAVLGECLRTWQQIHDAVAKSLEMLLLDPEKIDLGEETMMDAICRPRDVLIQIRDALKVQDYVLLADILKFEFADVTATWRTILTRIRREAEEQAG